MNEHGQHTSYSDLSPRRMAHPTDHGCGRGDLGAISDGELFIMGPIKDVLIVYGRNHYPDDIEATIQQVPVSSDTATISSHA